MPEFSIVGNLSPARLQALLDVATPHHPQLQAALAELEDPQVTLAPEPVNTIFEGPRDTARSGDAWDTDTLVRALRDVGTEVAQSPHGETALVTAHNLEPSLAQAALTEVALERGWAQETADGQIEWVQFSAVDAGWLGSVLQRIKAQFTGRADRPPLPEHPETLPNPCRLALVGDWGTALYGAPKFTQWAIQTGGLNAVVHLGDTYYAGTKKEVEKRLSKPWPIQSSPTEPTLSRFLNGNHEMYSGGKPYFSFIKDFKQLHPQTSSCFAMQNDHWLVIGLDTAWHGFKVEPAMQNGHLDDLQAEWLKKMVDNAGNRRVILLSHHQPFHFTGKVNAELTTDLQSLWDAEKVEVWYWGHEHFGVRYDRSPYGFVGRCLGHGGKPENRPSKVRNAVGTAIPNTNCEWKQLKMTVAQREIQIRVLDGPNPLVAHGAQAEDFGPQGWAVLNLDGPDLTEEWYLATQNGGFQLELP